MMPAGWTTRTMEHRYSGTYVGRKTNDKVVPVFVSSATTTSIVDSSGRRTSYKNVVFTYPDLGVVQMGDEVYWVTRDVGGYKRGLDIRRLSWRRIGTYPSSYIPSVSSNEFNTCLVESLYAPTSHSLAEAYDLVTSGRKAGARLSPNIAVAAMRGYVSPGIWYNNTLVGYVKPNAAVISHRQDYVGDELYLLGESVEYA